MKIISESDLHTTKLNVGQVSLAFLVKLLQPTRQNLTKILKWPEKWYTVANMPVYKHSFS